MISKETLPKNALAYPVKPLVAGLAVVGLVLIAVILLLFLAVALTGGPIEGRDLLIIPLMMPFAGIFIYLLSRSTGMALLTEQEVVMIRFRRRSSIRYDEIRTVKERDGHFPPNLVLVGEGKTLRVNRQLENFPRFYQALARRVSVLHPEKSTFPYRLKIRPAFILWNGFGLLCMLLILFGLFVLMIWNADSFLSSFFACTVPLFLLTIVTFLFVHAEIMPGKPVAWRFTPDEIHLKRMFQDWEVYPVQELEKIGLEERESNGYPHPAVILVILGVEHVISLRRAHQFGCEPEQLYLNLSDLYVGHV